MDEMKTSLDTLGFTMPSPAYIVGALIFSIIGMFGYYYGKKASLNTPKWIGIGLMLFPYVITDPLQLYLVGCGLCVCLYMYRK
jgi:uncharacterized membrane protein YdcZ (DUF606 family)